MVYGYDMALSAQYPNLTVLVIEDDVSLRDLYCEALKSDGYEIRTAVDGLDGIEQFRMFAPDMVLMDLMMPRMDGWQTLEEIRKISKCPVIIITGQGTTEDIIRGLLEAGADDYMVKPFGVPELIARVKAMIRRASPPVQQWS